jgi:hypothetical protein
VFVLDGAVRSWAPLEPRCLRWEFPLWHPAEDYSPALLKRPEDRRRQAAKEARSKEDDGALLDRLDELDPERDGHGVRQLRQALKWSHARATEAVARLVTAGILEVCQVSFTSGKRTEGVCAGVRRRAKN